MPTGPCETRTALLDAAEALFSARGYDAVGIRDLANEAGTNVASIKYHFGSKHELYLETVARAMARGGSAWDELRGSKPNSRLEAATILVHFIRAFFTQVLPPKGFDACGTLILREAMQPSAALDSVVREYIQPNQRSLVELLAVIRPEAKPKALAKDAQCILGQMMHHRIFRPILERLHGQSLDRHRLDELVEHVSSFSLRGLGCTDSFIRQAMSHATARQTGVAH